MRSLCVIAASLALAACSGTPRARIADTLVGYGISRSQADCVGERLQRELTPAQLLELARAAQAYRADDPDPARLSLADLLRVSSNIRDPEIPLTVARAAGRCGLVPLGFTSMVGALAG